jgi:hypothetical protein
MHSNIIVVDTLEKSAVTKENRQLAGNTLQIPDYLYTRIKVFFFAEECRCSFYEASTHARTHANYQWHI